VPIDGRDIPFTDQGRAALAQNRARLAGATASPGGRNDLSPCEPIGPTRLLQQPFPIQILLSGDTLVLLYEHNHTFEIAYLGQSLDSERDPGYLGNSVGRLTSSGVEVDSMSFRERTFLDDSGLPHSDQLRLHRQFVVGNGGASLDVETTITDPVMYSGPWKIRQQLVHAANEQIQEYTCGQGPTLETRLTRGANARSKH
jgi:hypothetical protein